MEGLLALRRLSHARGHYAWHSDHRSRHHPLHPDAGARECRSPAVDQRRTVQGMTAYPLRMEDLVGTRRCAAGCWLSLGTMHYQRCRSIRSACSLVNGCGHVPLLCG